MISERKIKIQACIAESLALSFQHYVSIVEIVEGKQTLNGHPLQTTLSGRKYKCVEPI